MSIWESYDQLVFNYEITCITNLMKNNSNITT